MHKQSARSGRGPEEEKQRFGQRRSSGERDMLRELMTTRDQLA